MYCRLPYVGVLGTFSWVLLIFETELCCFRGDNETNSLNMKKKWKLVFRSHHSTLKINRLQWHMHWAPKLNPHAHAFSSHSLSSQSARVLGFFNIDWLLCLSAADWLLQDLALKPQFPVSESTGIWWFSCRRTLRETSASYGMPLSRR